MAAQDWPPSTGWPLLNAYSWPPATDRLPLAAEYSPRHRCSFAMLHLPAGQVHVRAAIVPAEPRWTSTRDIQLPTLCSQTPFSATHGPASAWSWMDHCQIGVKRRYATTPRDSGLLCERNLQASRSPQRPVGRLVGNDLCPAEDIAFALHIALSSGAASSHSRCKSHMRVQQDTHTSTADEAHPRPCSCAGVVKPCFLQGC